MDTILTSTPRVAAAYIRRGCLAAFPTETVYGLGADALDEKAVRGIFEAKGRPSDNPLIVHVARADQVLQVATEVSSLAQRLLDAFTPGPLTLIVPKASTIPSVVTAGLETVGIRIPSHEVAQSFLDACETPVAAPSANRSGRPSPTSWAAVQEDLGGRIPCILRGGRTREGVESTVLDCTEEPPVLLRPGAVSVEALERVAGSVATASSETEKSARSPGTRHRHYAPRARVQLVKGPAEAMPGTEAAYIGLEEPDQCEQFRRCRVIDGVETYARELFHFFRECDRDECTVIYAQTVPSDGVGRALNDRLQRAAAR